jgi:cytochrome c biogenesis protein CcdA
VLPLLPIVVASALQRHRGGPVAVAIGLVLSSAGTGLVFSSFGFTLGLDREAARFAAAGLMAVAGLVLLLPRVQAAFAGAAAPLGRGADRLARRVPAGLSGQFLLGLLLGAVWVPCTGPTLAAALSLAAQSESLARAGVVMLGFGVGAVVPVLGLAYGSRRALIGRHAWMRALATPGKALMGALLLLVGALAVTGVDKVIEAWMVERMPDWLLELTTWL